MSPDDPAPSPAARQAARHIHAVVSVLRELDLGDTPPAAAYRAEEPSHDAR
ncbi:hypothetical protein J7I94_17555 [Streptomyces sp. ISL-12]|uniref:hypothetical protein n=1 Tax=Streptomyces sp. ISL-12 TaxID=2819177 RepID=UPI001BE8AE80|nr:hypothetical protein [Streptomyces sp. ISL-12]MBT2412356.1 hypothetical protein [Streptomyces sp. ISL-12]